MDRHTDTQTYLYSDPNEMNPTIMLNKNFVSTSYPELGLDRWMEQISHYLSWYTLPLTLCFSQYKYPTIKHADRRSPCKIKYFCLTRVLNRKD